MRLFLWFLILTSFNLIQAQQYYDSSDCSQDSSYPGSRYTCKSDQKQCSTFLVYRANQRFDSILNICRLFQADTDDLLRVNSLSSSSDILYSGREVLVPVTCSCIGNFFRASFKYMVSQNTTLPEIACAVFEGLVKSRTLVEENPSQEHDVKVGTMIDLPLRCACPDNFSNGVMYLVTYPLIEGDELNVLSKKFGISPIDISAANHFEPFPTVYPNTTILIPLKKRPIINFDIPNSPPPTPGFLPTITVEKPTSKKILTLYISVSVIGFFLIVTALVLCLWYARTLCKRKLGKLMSFNLRSSPLSCSIQSSPRSAQTGRSSANSCLSPDLLVGIKYSLKNYSIEDVRKATEDFVNKIGDKAYKASIDNVEAMIKPMRLEETRQVIDVHTKINHINIVNLLGVCYSDNEANWSYLVFELPSNGCLRNWLSNSSSSLRWHRRIQIAFDIATGLHYLHNCIFPSYAHMGVNSRNIFITENWRAKLTHIKTDRTCCDKVDIFEFGVVLLEIISGKEENADGKSLKDRIGFLGGGNGCFDQLRSFMDPCLREDYPLAEALCLAVLAKACVEDDPLHRPSMDDVLKVLVRLV